MGMLASVSMQARRIVSLWLSDERCSFMPKNIYKWYNLFQYCIKILLHM